MKAAGYSLEQKVEVTMTPGRIAIEPLNRVQYKLDDLLNGITKSNAHDEVSFGRPVGKESL